LEEQMSNPRKRRPEISDLLVLAAVGRAQLHRIPSGEAVPVWHVVEHLDVPRRSAAARDVRAQLVTLEGAGALASSRRHGVHVWQLTPAGRCRLTRARRRGEVPALPESPQHRRWRVARTLSSQEIERFRGELRDALEHALRLLDENRPVSSDAWFNAGERLEEACTRLWSASHCLYEWNEPTDDRADIDDRAARRNILMWRRDDR
jgi:hypothetical protein